MSEVIGRINGWTIERLPKAFDFKYFIYIEDCRKHFNSLKLAIDYASSNMKD